MSVPFTRCRTCGTLWCRSVDNRHLVAMIRSITPSVDEVRLLEARVRELREAGSQDETFLEARRQLREARKARFALHDIYRNSH